MIEFNKDNGLTCIFSGRMSTPECIEAEKKLNDNLDSSVTSITFDLTKVDYISSAFLRICLTMAKRMSAGGFSIIGVQPEVKKIFKIAGFDRLMSLE